SFQTIVERNGKKEVFPGLATDWVRDFFRERQLARRPGLVPFAGGCVGYLGYDAASWFESAIRGDETLPISTPFDGVWMFCRTMVVFDRVRQRMEIVSIVLTEEAQGSHERLRQLYDAAVGRTQMMEEKLRQLATQERSADSAEQTRDSAPKSNWTRQA